MHEKSGNIPSQTARRVKYLYMILRDKRHHVRGIYEISLHSYHVYEDIIQSGIGYLIILSAS